jgi:2-polyprenyl-3-methyl-5-hydroxy-6-metoxy-1,4-benzoquinol methylase
MLPDGRWFEGRLPCLFCRHAKQRKTMAEWRSICGQCRGLTDDELSVLYWAQEVDSDRSVVPPNLLRHSRWNSDARYLAARRAIDQRGITPGARVLDIGCGISAQADMFRDLRYIGADLNRIRLKRASTVNRWAGYAVEDITRMGWRDHSFDAVVCLEVIEHVPESLRHAVMTELFRVLQPDGVLVLSTPNGRITASKRVLGLKCERSHERELSVGEVQDLIERAGATLHNVETVDNLILPAGRIAAGVIHLAATWPALRRRLRGLATTAGYETLLYVASPAPSGIAAAGHKKERA